MELARCRVMDGWSDRICLTQLSICGQTMELEVYLPPVRVRLITCKQEPEAPLRFLCMHSVFVHTDRGQMG